MKEMKKMSILWGIIMVLIFSLLTFFGLKWKNKYKGYFDLEDKLVKNTQKYYESNHEYPKKGSEEKIFLKELRDNEVIDELIYNDDKCDGYVIVKNNNVIEYKAYIKCNNYTTKGYN